MIEVRNLNAKLGKFELKNVTFKVNEGEFYILLGPTGAGKSIILETIGGLVPEVNGDVFIDSELISNLKPEHRKISICYQDYSLFPHFTVKENILYGLKFLNSKEKENLKGNLEKITTMLKIENLLDRYPLNLSGGEKQRVSLARALIVKPKVVLLDEPLSALDSHIKDQLMRDIKIMHKEFGMTTIMVTHSFQEAYYLGENLSVINDGEIVQSGKMKDILNNPKSHFVANFVGMNNIIKIDDSIDEKFKANGNKFIGIRPKDIKISKTKIDEDIVFKGNIYEIADMGTYIEVKVKVDNKIYIIFVLITEYIEMGIKIDDEIFIGINRKNIHMLAEFKE